MNTIFWSFLVRFGQAWIDASLTLMIGVLTAAILRRMVGSAGTRRLFGGGARGLLSGWLAGMLLPVCSLGVIPVARELRRVGVPGGTVLAFVLAAPLLNPISFLYGLTLAEPKVILSFAMASLLLTTAAGFLWDQVFANSTDAAESAKLAAESDALPVPPEGVKRMVAVGVSAARDLAGRDLLYYFIGLTGTALLAALIPFGSLQGTMHHTDPRSPLLMTALAIPLFSSPLPGMMKIGLMFDHGNSIGAAFVLFAIGIGTSLGTIAWLVVDFGAKRILPWFLTYVMIVLGIGYICERVLYDTRKSESVHTHAFDDYASPFTEGTPGLMSATLTKLKEKMGPLERPTTIGFFAMIAVGGICRRLDRRGTLERWLTTAVPQHAERNGWDIRVPSTILGLISLLGLVIFSIIGAFVYYPDREQCLDQMFAVYAEANVAVKTGKTEEAIRHLELWDQLVRKLEVGVYLRNFGVTKEQAKAAEDLREAIEEVRDELLANNPDGAREKFNSAVGPAYRVCKEAYPKK
jgi:uncharacterized protein